MRDFYGGVFGFIKLESFNLIIMFQRKKEDGDRKKKWGGTVDSMKIHMDMMKFKMKKNLNNILSKVDRGTESS